MPLELVTEVDVYSLSVGFNRGFVEITPRRGSLPVPSVHFPVAVFLHSYEERINISIWATAHLPLP